VRRKKKEGGSSTSKAPRRGGRKGGSATHGVCYAGGNDWREKRSGRKRDLYAFLSLPVMEEGEEKIELHVQRKGR